MHAGSFWLVGSTFLLWSWAGTLAAQPLSPAQVGPRLVPSEAQPEWQQHKPRLDLRSQDLVVASLGVASFALGLALQTAFNARAEDFRNTAPGTAAYVRAERRWDSSNGLPLGLMSGGATDLSVASAALLWRSEREAFPVWASALAATTAVSLLAGGASEMLRGDACSGDGLAVDRRLCSLGYQRRIRGMMLLTASLPFVTISVTQLVRTLFFRRQER